jgi:crossover junction endodeoxyribonuclease RusA
MSRAIQFFVAGMPVTQGSKRAFVVKGRPIVTEVNADKLKLWRHAINDEARKARNGFDEPLSGAVAVSMDFYMPKPASEPKRRRTWPTKARSGDVDKLARAGLDAMTHVLFNDDAQVVTLMVRKDWSLTPGVEITVREVVE